MAEQNNGITYFVVGVGIGVAVGLLLAPRSGEETRRLLRSKAEEGSEALRKKTEEGREYLKRRTSEIRDSASDLVDRSRDVIARQKEQITAAVEAGKQAYRESIEDSSPLT